MKKYVKNHKSRLTAGRPDAIVKAKGLINPFVSGAASVMEATSITIIISIPAFLRACGSLYE